MRLVVDATSLLLHSAGVKNYTFHWLNALRATARNHRADGFPFLKELGTLNHDGSNIGKLATLPRLAFLYSMNRFGFPSASWDVSGADLFHCSNQVRRPPLNVPLTATIHDLTCWLMPDLHKRENVAADLTFSEQIWKRARGLIAVSESTRQDAIKVLDIDPDRIRTIHSGVGRAYFDAKPAFWDRPYLLFVGTIEPRKNINLLLDAFSAVRQDLKRSVDLVLAGPIGWKSQDVMGRLAEGVRGVRHIGYVPEEKLPGLVAGAMAFVYPSLYEGFGFPVAQAMAARVPVITANNSSLPEIAGEGALYVDAKSRSELTSALERIIEDAELRSKLADAGRARADRFRWEVCARECWRFFEELV